MFIQLKTAEVWRLKTDFSADDFFIGLNELLGDDDTLVVGSYNPSDDVAKWLESESNKQKETSIYTTFFKFNLAEYPRGRSYELPVSYSLLHRLVGFSLEDGGSKDKQLFFDHVLAFRFGQPVLPLFNFHDAFIGGDLFLSGLYTDEIVGSFAKTVGGSARLEKNPEYP